MKTIIFILLIATVTFAANFDTTTVTEVFVYVEHELTYEFFIVQAVVWWKSGTRWYVRDINKMEWWSDKPVRIVRR